MGDASAWKKFMTVMKYKTRHVIHKVLHAHGFVETSNIPIVTGEIDFPLDNSAIHESVFTEDDIEQTLRNGILNLNQESLIGRHTETQIRDGCRNTYD